MDGIRENAGRGKEPAVLRRMDMPILCVIAFCVAIDTAAIARELKKIRKIMEEAAQ